jgi:hypothetical protein
MKKAFVHTLLQPGYRLGLNGGSFSAEDCSFFELRDVQSQEHKFDLVCFLFADAEAHQHRAVLLH